MRHVIAPILFAAALSGCSSNASSLKLAPLPPLVPSAPPRAAPASVPNVNDPRGAAIDRLFERWTRPGMPGCAVAVAREGEVIFARGYGSADIEHDALITNTTSFHVASISKQFTAAAVLLLAAEGRLSLDDDVRRYVPDVPHLGGARITLRHLLHHTSGLRDQWALLRAIGYRVDDVITDGDILDLVRRQEDLNFPPGTEFLYSNTNYTLLAHVVHNVSGKPLGELARERMFAPLGLTGTHFQHDHTRLVPGRANGYERGRDGAWHLRNPPFDTVGASSLHATAIDLVRWIEAITTGRLGGDKLAAAMLERGRLADGTTLSYAAGLEHDTYRGLPVVAHGGGDPGFRAYLMRVPSERHSFACVCNTPEAPPPEVVHQMADVFLEGKLAPKPAPPAAAADPAHAGVYYSAQLDEVARVEVRDGRFLVAGHSMPVLGADRFRWGNAEVAFRAAGGRAMLERTAPGGRVAVFERMAPHRPAPRELAALSGSYESPELGVRYLVKASDDAIGVRPPRVPDRRFTAIAPDLFHDEDGRVLHVLRKDGQVTGFTLSTGRIRRLRFERR